MTINLKLNERRSGEASITKLQGSDLVCNVLDAVEQNRGAALKELIGSERKTLPYHIAAAQECYSDELWQAMENRNLSQVEFAKRAHVPKQFLTKVFRGGNCTIETLVRLAFALDYKLNIHLTPNEVGCAWLHRIDEAVPRQIKQHINVWAETTYTPTVVMAEEYHSEKVTAQG